MTFEKLELEKNKKGLFHISCDLYMRKNGDFIMCPMGRNYAINEYRYGNIKEISDDELFELIKELLEISLNRDEYLTVDKCGKDADKIYIWEKEDYKIDKCQSVKYIDIAISNNYQNRVCLVDLVCLGNHHWGGGRFLHQLPINCSKEKVIGKVREIFNYKEGHLPSSKDESLIKKV